MKPYEVCGIALSGFALVCLFPVVGSGQTREIQSLDGNWEIVFDTDNIGRENKWHQTEVFSKQSDRREIEVPCCWERIRQDYEGVAYYRYVFPVAKHWESKTVRLQFDAVNYLTEVWLNGEVVGYHEGGFTPFEFRVDQLLNPGKENTLILRVIGPIILQDKRIDGIGPLETPQWRGGITGGVWQSVRMIATGESLVKDVFIVPNTADDSATFHLELENTSSASKSVQVMTTIREAKNHDRVVAESVRTLSLRPGVSKHTETLPIPDARHWSPAHPHLYQADVTLVGTDHWTTRFGMREFTIRDKQFYLNDEPIYLKATFFEGLYPNAIAVPDNRKMAVREIQLAKDAGFNMIRPWRRPPAPMWLDLADEMGVLVVGSPVLECMRLPLSSPQLPNRVEREIRETVLRDRNRACMVQWELFNELHRPILKQMMRPMALLTRELDPTRLILDESGGWADGARIYLPGDFEPMRFNDIHNYPGPFINKRLFDGFLSIGLTDDQKKARGLHARTPGRNVAPGLMSFVSELGYGSLPNLVQNNDRFRRDGNPLTPAYRYHHRLEKDQKRVLKESGFEHLYTDFEQFCLDQQSVHGAANKRMIEAVRANPNVSGYCIHALSAGDWILGAGLIDLWRQPKTVAYEATKAANQPRLLVTRMTSRNVYASRGSILEVIGVNESESLDATLNIEIVSGTGEIVFDNKKRMVWERGVSQMSRETLDTRTLRGSYTVSAIVCRADGETVSESTCRFDVFAEQDLSVPTVPFAVLDQDGRLTRYLQQSNHQVIDFDATTPHSTPVLVTKVNPATATGQKRFADLRSFVESGGTAVYLQGAGKRYQRNQDNQVRSATVPISARVEAAQGLWTCIPHLVQNHPVFEGLPSGGMMREIYENVWATQTLRDLAGETIVASIGFKWFSGDHKLHYSGPSESWWGSDLAIVPIGKGRIVFSQLRIIENLGADPVADKLLGNLIRFCNETAKPSP
ncbi:glycoside hydrolase family 2 protein [Rhodopirellula sp. SWK7]|uniref:glycoside hydrolase family 2 protein n=1 Tax=Rhodopirellula sp. SWK7 TaxID=595460 RepID=UPI0002BFAD0C|nr:glycoside hydrolase family 2 [Rhodopirellula sp. SWK7]EMI43683.1 glycoside hydrolase family 2 [Rhodopirellula sp. SWK7]